MIERILLLLIATVTFIAILGVWGVVQGDFVEQSVATLVVAAIGLFVASWVMPSKSNKTREPK